MHEPHQSAGSKHVQVKNVRHVDGVGWQVLLESSSQWHTCRKEQDACFIASGLQTMDAASRGEVFGNEVAEELEAFAAVASRILGADEAERIMQTAKAVRSKTS